MKPRQLLPGSRYLITRRCTQRQFLLQPSKLTNQIVRYCVAVAAERYGIALSSMCVLSNHWHLVVTDPAGTLPRFLQWVHEYIAKCVNAACGRWENMWSNESTSVVRLEGDEDVIDKIVYCLANPVSAGLVAHGNRWPGVRSSAMDLAGASYEVERPGIFFREDGAMPAVATLRFARPDVCPELSDEELAQRVAELLAEREAAVRDEHARAGVPFLGVKGIRRQKRTDRPGTTEPRRKLSPQIAAKDPVYKDTTGGPTAIWVGPGPNSTTGWAATTYDTILDTPSNLPNYADLMGLCEAGCYSPEQRILFDDRFSSIEDAYESEEHTLMTLVPGATFETFTFMRNIIANWTVDIAPAEQDIITFRMRSGGELRVTPDHPLLTSEGVMVQASDLVVGESLVKQDRSTDPIVFIEQTTEYIKVYNLNPITTDLTSNILVAQGYLNGSARYQSEYLEYINRVLLRDKIPSELIPRGHDTVQDDSSVRAPVK